MQNKILNQRRARNRSIKYKYFFRKTQVIGKYVLLFAFFLGVLVFFYLLFFRSTYFKVFTVNIFGTQSFVNSRDLEEVVIGKVEGESIFRVNKKQLENILMETFQGSKEIRVYKVYPGTVNVEVFERIPLALIYNDFSDHLYMVDEDGYVLGIVDEGRTNLPKIKYDGEIGVGLFVDQQVVPVYLELVSALNSENIQASSMSFSANYATVYSGGIEILVGNNKNKHESAGIVSSLIRQMNLEGKKLKKIDLRYDKVIVLYD
jgi:cell division septal protein FtsQ